LIADIVLKDAGLRALGKCPPRNTKALFTWIWNRKPFAIAAGKSDFIFYPDDFVSLAGQSQNDRQFENFIESFLEKRYHPWIKVWLVLAWQTRINLNTHRWANTLQRILQTDAEVRKTDDEFVDIYSSWKVTILANILQVSLAAIILLIPVFLLFLVEMSRPMMTVVASIFVVLFSVVVSSVTGAKVQEVFCGTAA
jgi:hypothetical protein